MIPLIFILSAGMDPITEIEKIAVKMGCKRGMKIISLGSGQGPYAKRSIEAAMGEGN